MKKLTIIYVYYNTPKEIIDSLDSLSSQLNGIEIIIIDNNSPEPLPRSVVENRKIKIINNKVNKGFGRAVNQASKVARGKFLLFLNPDTILPPRFIYKILKKMNSDEKIGLMGVRYSDERGRGIRSVGGFPTMKRTIFSFSILNRLLPENRSSEDYWMNKFDYSKEAEVPVIGGACMVVRSDVFKAVKGFDRQFFMYFEEADLSERIRRAGYKVIYYPEITITHLIGKSSTNNDLVRKRFEESRFKIINKYEGFLNAVISEGIIRFITFSNILLLCIISISISLNFYKIDSLIMFYGDFGRDYLAARDMLLTGQIPLRGIPSSVVWLHQGPLSIYLIAFALILTNFNPIGPAILYTSLGVFSTILTYIVGEKYFNKHLGLIAAALYATSPLTVINARMPYHTSPIPFFTLLLFLVLKKILDGNKRFLPLLFFLAGILFLLELSNSVLLIVLFSVFFISKIKFTKSEILKSFGGFILGISPFVLYDVKNSFVQTGGFFLWVINRVRLFFGVSSDFATSSNLTDATIILWDEVNRIVFPHSSIIVFLLLLISIVLLLQKQKKYLKSNLAYRHVILLWFFIPILGFLVHAKPGVAYSPILFPVISLLISLAFYILINFNRLLILLIPILVIINTTTIIQNNYFLTTRYDIAPRTLVQYGYGLDFTQRRDAVKAIISNAKGEEFSIHGGGYLGEIITGIDNYKYLIFYYGGKVSELGSIEYKVYENKKEIKNKKKIIFESRYIAVTKNE